MALDVEACDKQIGYVLMQDQLDRKKKPLGYWSQLLTADEIDYNKKHKMCFAVIWAVSILRLYL